MNCNTYDTNSKTIAVKTKPYRCRKLRVNDKCKVVLLLVFPKKYIIKLNDLYDFPLFFTQHLTRKRVTDLCRQTAGSV